MSTIKQAVEEVLELSFVYDNADICISDDQSCQLTDAIEDAICNFCEREGIKIKI